MDYEIIVVGGGHAGCEAALASARLGMKTAIFSLSLEAVANMPCNPHIGGSSKGHLVREIDALGGEMGKNADKAALQTKMLNTKKGPAVQALRFQADKIIYPQEMLKTLGLENRRTHLPNQLSGGQQQRVSIGRAMINNPAIMLADEPTGNLDSKASEEIIALLKLSNKKFNQTVIIITHDLEIAKEAERVITIEDGKIIKDERN
mgnify:CR=1 FL=1